MPKGNVVEHAIGLSRRANSFFDPESGANLFKSSPVYRFRHKPTKVIMDAVASGRLYDINGTLSKTNDDSADMSKVRADIEKEIRPQLEKEIRAELEKEIRAEIEAENSKASKTAKAKTTKAKADKEADSEESE